MFKHILVATDGSTRADRAIALALEHGDRARITALMVVPDYSTLDVIEVVVRDGPDFETLRRNLELEGERRLREVLGRHPAAAARIQPLVRLGDRPSDEIVSTAERLECDLIVMASHGGSPLKSAFLGSQTLQVLGRATVPVLVAR